ncbi:helix-turn-helix domain-containing protein [Pimelobacter simplex]|uniref:AlbA family DNA-binding domain-containing protein n=1 Tax=Nocardioides simplex TaxID=2045 RepID=UPI003AAC0837
MVLWSLYTAPPDAVDADLLRTFIAAQHEANLLTESTTLELKEKRRGDNVAKAVAGFANTDGGIVLVGVDESSASFDDAPGVLPEEVVAIDDSCRNVLDPKPLLEIFPVALPSGGKVVIVVRVAADPYLRPVCKGGTVYVRAPGHTVPATRQQIIELSRSPQGSVATSTPVMALSSTYAPPYDLIIQDDRDALIRIAGGVRLRPSVNEFAFGTTVREDLHAILAITPLFLYPALALFRWQRPDGRPNLTASSTSSTAAFGVDYPQDGMTTRVAATFRREGPRISYALDLHVRLRSGGAVSLQQLSRVELCTALLVGIETAALILPDHLSTAAGSAPQQVEPPHIWVETREKSLGDVLDLESVQRPSESSIVGRQWVSALEPPGDAGELVESLRTRLHHLYLDLRLDDAEQVADADLELAQRERELIQRLAVDR